MAELYSKLHAPKDIMNLWARVGVTIKDVSYQAFKDNPEETLIRAIKDGNVSLDGDSYVYHDEEENDFTFDMSPLKISLKE